MSGLVAVARVFVGLWGVSSLARCMLYFLGTLLEYDADFWLVCTHSLLGQGNQYRTQ
jgi:hypothetical protein